MDLKSISKRLFKWFPIAKYRDFDPKFISNSISISLPIFRESQKHLSRSPFLGNASGSQNALSPLGPPPPRRPLEGTRPPSALVLSSVIWLIACALPWLLNMFVFVKVSCCENGERWRSRRFDAIPDGPANQMAAQMNSSGEMELAVGVHLSVR